jgi:ubiquinone/menaquinone biosynthesis C-methylase UbiE
VGVSHPVFARLFSRVAVRMDEQGFRQYRQRLVAGLSGKVIEIGAGTGANFVHYPAAVESVLAVEPEPYLRDQATLAAGSTTRISVVDGVAEDLPASDDEFDAAVVSLALCSVKDPSRAIAEIRRVLRPGGTFRFLEHVRGEGGLAGVQRVVDATLWPLFAGGCHTGRDTVATVRAAGFAIETLDAFRYPPTQLQMPASPHVLVTATKPA